MSLALGGHMTPFLLLIGLANSEKLGHGEKTIPEASQTREGQPCMTLALGGHVTPFLVLIGQFRKTWAWRENYSGCISDRRMGSHVCHWFPAVT